MRAEHDVNIDKNVYFLSSNKILNNRALNSLGYQLFRVLIARLLLLKRRNKYLKNLSSNAEKLFKFGIIVIDNFLQPDQFKALLIELQDCESKLAKLTPVPDKYGVTRKQYGIHKRIKSFPLSNKFLLQNETLLELIRINEGWDFSDNFSSKNPILKYEILTQVEEPVRPSTCLKESCLNPGDLHTDTFHTVTKAFLSLSDITLENSPFVYCLGSHKLSVRRLIWEYYNSIRGEQYSFDNYHGRLYDRDIKRMKLDPQPYTLSKNSLIITDTFGFHHRGQMSKKGNTRRLLRMDFRSNPFGIS